MRRRAAHLAPSRPSGTSFREIAEVEWIVDLDDADAVRVTPTGRSATHPLLRTLRERGHPGLVLFSSGSTGKQQGRGPRPRARCSRSSRRASARCARSRSCCSTTSAASTRLLYTLSNGGCVVTVGDRTPDAVLRGDRAAPRRAAPDLADVPQPAADVERSLDAARPLDRSRTITYGTEPMPESTLQPRARALPPATRCQQTYGLSELGILRSQVARLRLALGAGRRRGLRDPGRRRRSCRSRRRSAMLGYLNAPEPVRPRTAGSTPATRSRSTASTSASSAGASEIINVGGEKVYPAEVESVLLEHRQRRRRRGARRAEPDHRADRLRAESRRCGPRIPGPWRRESRRPAGDSPQPFKIPVKVMIIADPQYSSRFKKTREVDR